MDRVFHILDEQKFTVEGLAPASFDQEKFAKLTGLPDGAVISIHALAEKWLKDCCTEKHGH